MGYLKVQFSDKKVVDDSSEAWTTVVDTIDVKLHSRLGQARSVVVTLSNNNNERTYSYELYTRVRCFARRMNVPIFLGRIVKINPAVQKGMVDLLCVDYLHDLSFRSTSATEYSGARRSDIVKDILSGGDAPRRGVHSSGTYKQSIRHDLHIEDSAYVARIQRFYGNDDGEMDTEIGDGYEPMLHSIEKLGMEDPWQDLQVIRQDATMDGEQSEQQYELYTSAALFGDRIIPAPVGTTRAIYVGSNKPFNNIHFIPVNDGDEYDLIFEYRTGGSWQSFVPNATSLIDDTDITGTISLSTTPSILELGRSWVSSDADNFSFLPDSIVVSPSSAEVPAKTDPIFMNKYWIRITSDLTSATLGNRGISSLTLANIGNNSESKWDYRAEDSLFFDRVFIR